MKFQPSRPDRFQPYGWAMTDALDFVTGGASKTAREYAASYFEPGQEPDGSEAVPVSTPALPAGPALSVPPAMPRPVAIVPPPPAPAPAGPDYTVPVLIVVASVLVSGGVWWWRRDS